MKKVILLISIITLSFTSFAQDEWTLIHPYPTLSSLMGVHFISDQEGWVVGSDGLIMHTNDGCETWDIQHKNFDESFWSIFFIDDSEGWAVGWSNIYHTTNKGETWEKQTRPDVVGDLTDVYFVNPDTGWIVGTYKIVLKTTDGGDNWTEIMNNPGGGLSFWDVSFTDELNGCAVGGKIDNLYKAFVMVTSDGGLTWTDTSPTGYNRLNAVEFLDSNTGWACGINRTLLKTTDGGISWVNKTENYFWSTFHDIHFFDDSTGLLVGDGMVRLTFDAGHTWDSIVHFSDDSYMHAFSGWGDGGVAVGWAGAISSTFDGGSSWENYKSNITTPFLDIGFLSSNRGYAISGYTNSKNLISSVDGGSSWIVDTIVENGPFYKMQVSGQCIYLLNSSSQLMKTTNAGADWQLLDVPSETSIYSDLNFVNENTGYLCSYEGILFKTNNGGLAWENHSLDPNFELSDMFFLNENLGWMLDRSARLVFRTTNGGNNWESGFVGDEYQNLPQSVFFINENEGFVTTSDGIIFKSTDGGETWEEFYYFSNGINSEIYFINETEGWYKSNTKVYHTFDGGSSWINEQELDAGLNCMFFFNNEQGWIGGGDGLVAFTSFTVNTNEFGEVKTSVTVFPNPAKDDIEIELYDNSDKINDIKIFSIQGKQVMHLENILKPNALNINISELIGGTYIICITSDKGENLVKFIVQ